MTTRADKRRAIGAGLLVGVQNSPPFRAVDPIVSGTFEVGETVQVDQPPGVYTGVPSPTFAYQWLTRANSGAAWSDISGATSSTYAIVSGDAGNELGVRVTASNGNAPDNVWESAGYQVPALGAPVNESPPTVSGNPSEGSELVGNRGSWTGSPTMTFSYQWLTRPNAQTAWSNIAGATEKDYTPVGTDVGNQIALRVLAQNNPGGSSSADSLPVTVVSAVAPDVVMPPSFAGAPIEGETISAVPGIYSLEGQPFTPTDRTYQWYRIYGSGGSTNEPIPGATGIDYVPTAADRALDASGVYLTVRERAYNGAQFVEAFIELGTGPIGPPGVMTVATYPTIEVVGGGPAVVGAQLRISGLTGTGISTVAAWWSRNGNTEVRYQAGLSGPNWEDFYTLQAGDEGAYIFASFFIGTGNAGENSEATAPLLGPILASTVPTNSVAPSIAGTAEAGQVLTATAGTWSAGTVTGIWQYGDDDGSQINWSDIAGATGLTFTIPSGGAAVGRYLRYFETADDGANGAASLASNQLGPVVAVQSGPPLNADPPTISGNFRVGGAYQFNTGTWSGASPITYAYEIRAEDNTLFASGSATAGANGGLTVPVGAEGKRLRVRITATNSVTDVLAESALSPVVVAAGSTVLFTASDLTYLGGFRSAVVTGPGVTDLDTFRYGMQGMCFNPNGDGGNGSLIAIGHQQARTIGEMSIPAPVDTTNYGSMNQAAVLQAPQDVITTWGALAPNASTQIVASGIAIDPDNPTDLLVSGFVYYDGSGTELIRTHFRVQGIATLSAAIVTGPVLVGTTRGPHHSAHYMCAVPAEHQGALGGKMLTGGSVGIAAIASVQSIGPSIRAFNPAQVPGTDPVPDTELMDYPSTALSLPTQHGPGNPDPASQNNLFNLASRVPSVFIPEGSRSVVFSGIHGTGPYSYPPSAPPYGLRFWAYDIDDLEQVRLGNRDPWSVAPYEYFNPLPSIVSSPSGWGTSAYDPATKRIFMVDRQANGPDHIIHVFQHA